MSNPRAFRILVILAATAAAFAFGIPDASAASYCGKISGTETGGMPGDSVSYQFAAPYNNTSLGSPRTVSTSSITISGTMYHTQGRSIWYRPGPNRCANNNNGAPTGEQGWLNGMDAIFVSGGSPSNRIQTFATCGNGMTCSFNANRTRADFTVAVPLSPGLNQVYIHGQHGYENYFKCNNPLGWTPCHGSASCPSGASACTTGTRSENANGIVYVNYVPPTCTISAACTVNPNPPAGRPYQVNLTWGPLSSCGNNAMEKGADPPISPPNDPSGAPYRASIWQLENGQSPSSNLYVGGPTCSNVFCQPANQWGNGTSYTDRWVVPSYNYQYKYRIKIAPQQPSNEVIVPVNDCACAGICPPANDAVYVTMTSPGTVLPGQTFPVTVTMREMSGRPVRNSVDTAAAVPAFWQT